MERFY